MNLFTYLDPYEAVLAAPILGIVGALIWMGVEALFRRLLAARRR